MPVRFTFKSVFHREFDRLSLDKQQLVSKATDAVIDSLSGKQMSYGLRIKKLTPSGLPKVFEARVNIDLRIVWTQSKDEVIFSLIGNHDDVQRFLKNL